jgi:xanthine dehydrogenase YagT iron-sulfur-binding subunit
MLDELRAEGVEPSEAEVRQRMSGNLCPRGAYPGIAAAILEAAR